LVRARPRTGDAALKTRIDIANRIAACGPLGIKATLEAAHLAINDSADAATFAKLEAEYASLYGKEDFIEGCNTACHEAPDPRCRAPRLEIARWAD
jgi:enoyl-CoA hydratase/carnithine racemase